MKTIIAPTDFTPVSLNAVNYAADMAASTNAKLLILHASEVPFGTTPEYDETEIEEKLISLKKYLDKRTENKIQINFKQVNGIIENELMKMCSYKNPFAVIMATHGTSLRKLFFIESITVYLSINLKYPVIVVPENAVFEPIHKIALATDLKDVYDLPVEKISAIVNAFGAELHIVHVNNGHIKFDSNSVEVKIICASLNHLHPKLHFINHSKNIQDGILSFADAQQIDMILTIPKKHAFFHTSESKQLIFNSPVTVMAIQ